MRIWGNSYWCVWISIHILIGLNVRCSFKTLRINWLFQPKNSNMLKYLLLIGLLVPKSLTSMHLVALAGQYMSLSVNLLSPWLVNDTIKVFFTVLCLQNTNLISRFTKTNSGLLSLVLVVSLTSWSWLRCLSGLTEDISWGNGLYLPLLPVTGIMFDLPHRSKVATTMPSYQCWCSLTTIAPNPYWFSFTGFITCLDTWI